MKMVRFMLIGVVLMLALVVSAQSELKTSSSDQVREAVVLIKGLEGGSCSGVQVKTDSGRLVILTAAHCRGLLFDDMAVVENEARRTKAVVRFIAEDDRSDLMMLGGSERIGHISIADSTTMHERAYTMTHGAGVPAYRTDGEVLDEYVGGFVVDEIITQEDRDRCVSQPKHAVIAHVFGGYLCVLDVKSTRTTTAIVPGSSGGPLLNERGQLIGIASFIDTRLPIFGFFVRLEDIRSFADQAAQ